MISAQRWGEVGKRPGIEPPALAPLPGFALPDRCSVLQAIDAPACRVERGLPVWGAGGHDHRGLADAHGPGPVQDRHPAEVRPPPAGLLDDGREPGADLALVRLVLETGHAR